MKENTQLTMKDIAKQFGVSVTTVSRALKDFPRISLAKRRAIQQYAKEHGFTPNAIAVSLHNSRIKPMKVIGVILPEFVHYYFSSVLAGIEEMASRHGYRIMVAQSMEEYEREVRICQSFLENKVCGIIVSQAKNTKQYDHFQRLIDKGIPLVFYDRICTGINANRVVVDDYCGAFNAVSYLIETGCRRIAFFGSAMTLEISKNRFNGYKDALLKYGMEMDKNLVHICDNRTDAEQITPPFCFLTIRPTASLPSTTTQPSASFMQPREWDCACPRMWPSAGSPTASAQRHATLCSPPLTSMDRKSVRKRRQSS